MSGCLAKRIGLQLPPVNFHLISCRFLKQLGLPEDKIFPALSRMYEWSLPPGLWLSADINAFPTRVYVMGMFVVVIRIIYNIHGQGYFEKVSTANDAFASDSSNTTCDQDISRDQLDRVSYRLARSCLDNVNIKADCLPIHQVAKQPGEVLINSIESMACFQDHELDATTMLQNLETWHQENADRFGLALPLIDALDLWTRHVPTNKKAMIAPNHSLGIPLISTLELWIFTWQHDTLGKHKLKFAGAKLPSVISDVHVEDFFLPVYFYSHDYGKDLQTYLKYCKDVIFSGAKMSYKEEILVKHFWELYEKLEKE
ncbi:hypothetical protein KI387_018232, partial [Taxus chinensis]